MQKGTIEINHSGRLIYPSFSSFLLSFVKEKVSLNEAIAEYEKNGVKLSRVAYWKQVRKLVSAGKIHTKRHEQLYLFSMVGYENKLTGSMNSLNINHRTIDQTHTAHRILLSMQYAGTQPITGATYVKAFGRYGTARQAVYRTGNITIIAYNKKLNVWVHKPAGVRTNDQLIEAKVSGYKALIAFAQTHSLTLEGYLERVLYSHHVVENPNLNAALKELIEAYPQIEARLGTKVCPSSHKGKVEHEGKARPDRVIRGDQVARGLEYITLDFPEQYADFCKLIPEYHAQLKLHLEVEARTLEAIKELTEAIKKGKVL